MPIAVYPGTFDPITNGHSDLIERATLIFDKVIVGVAASPSKRPRFSLQQRVGLAHRVLDGLERVEIREFDILLVEFTRQCSADVILRGLRAVSDFEFEFQLAHMNRRLNPEIETVFMMTGEDHFYVSSNMVREVASFGGKVTGLVPEHVERRLAERFGK